MIDKKTNKPKILYVDDEKENLTVFKFAFMENYKIFTASSANEGMQILADNPDICVIVTDQRMPHTSGVEFLSNTTDLYPDCLRIVVTGYSDTEAVIDAINKGQVYHFVKKPWEKGEFSVILHKAIESYKLRKENKKLLHELQEHNKTLEQKVQERTTELDEKNKELNQHKNQLEKLVQERTQELEQAKQHAESANKLKSSFLANMSHEIRTPLNAIVGFSALIASPGLDNDQKETYYSYIESSTTSLLRLIDDILDISRIEAKQMVIYPQEIKVQKILRELHETFTDELYTVYPEKNISFQINTESLIRDLTLITDPVRLKQVLSNLISNAIKYTDLGSVEFGHKILPENNKIIFYVQDTGIGIEKQDSEKIFDSFQKLDNTKGKLYRGAGLGLYISKNLVNIMGGEIWIESTKGKGSTFYFSLPSNTSNTTIQNTPASGSKTNYLWEDYTILVAEDEPINFTLIKSYLKGTGATVLHASNGDEAVEMSKNEQPDLILMDIKMPQKNGLHAAEEIKTFLKVPIIAQTAYAMKNDIDRILASGCDDFIAKPYSKIGFLSKIAKWLNN